MYGVYQVSRIGIRSFVGCLKTRTDWGELGFWVWHVPVLQIALPFLMLIVLKPTLDLSGNIYYTDVAPQVKEDIIMESHYRYKGMYRCGGL